MPFHLSFLVQLGLALNEALGQAARLVPGSLPTAGEEPAPWAALPSSGAGCAGTRQRSPAGWGTTSPVPHSVPQPRVELPLPLCPRCQERTCTQPLRRAPTLQTQDGFDSSCPPSTPLSRAWGRVLTGGLTPSPGTWDAARAMAPSLCRQLCHGASAAGGSLIIDGWVSREGGC